MAKKENETGMVKKAFYKKWWFWVIIIVVLAAIIGSSGDKDEDNTDTSTTSTAQDEETASDGQTNDVSADKFVEEVKTVIQGAISSKTETITDVVLENGDLCVYVDFSKADPSPLTLEDLALSRTSSITDAILELKDYDKLWETITVDFGDVGHITNSKTDMKNGGFGRYFPVEDFKIE